MTVRTGFHKKFKFRVEEQGFAVGAFQTMSELAVEVSRVDYREGGSLIADKSPGLVDFVDVTLERGIVTSTDLYDWLLQVVDAAADVGLSDPAIRRTLDLVQLDRANNEIRRWRLHNCWPMRFSAGDWDNEADENVIESVTLAYDYYTLVNNAPFSP